MLLKPNDKTDVIESAKRYKIRESEFFKYLKLNMKQNKK